MTKKYLNHPVKTEIPEEFLGIGLRDYSYNNDAVGCMAHPLLENYYVYPVGDYLEALENDNFPENPEKWFIFNPNVPEDSCEHMSVIEVVEFFKSRIE